MHHQGCNICDIFTISRRPCDGFRRGFDRNDRRSAAIAAAQTEVLFGDFSEGAKAQEHPSRGRAARLCAHARARRAHRRLPAAADVERWWRPKTANLATPDAPTSQNRGSGRGGAPKNRNESERTRGFNEDSGRNHTCRILRDHSWKSLVCFAAIGALLRSFLLSFRRKPSDERLDADSETGRTPSRPEESGMREI